MGKRQGAGVMRYATGQVASGEWQDNRLARPEPVGGVASRGEAPDATPDGRVPAEPAQP